MSQKLVSTADVCERRHTSRKLVREATECPHIYLLRVLDALGNLGADPIRSATFGLSVLFLLRQEDGEAKICKLDIAIHVRQNVVTLDVPM